MAAPFGLKSVAPLKFLNAREFYWSSGLRLAGAADISWRGENRDSCSCGLFELWSNARNMRCFGTLEKGGPILEETMVKKLIIVAITLLFSAAAFAQQPKSSTAAPGQQMHHAKRSTGPGASEYTPGHKMQKSKYSKAPGASEYAPGHQTTGASRMNK